MKKYYAVRKGTEPGIYDSWERVKPLVTGFKGAEYKSFQSLQEARDYLKEITPFNDNKDFDALEENEMVCYVDGSYNLEKAVYGYGCVSFTKEGKKTYKGALEGENSYHRNVAGEIEGAKFAVNKALEDGKDTLYLHYDYAGIEKWAKGEWKAKISMTQDYRDFMQEKMRDLKVHFIKIKAHSNDLYNDQADKLAKEAVGI